MSAPLLGDTAPCALCGADLVYCGADLWIHPLWIHSEPADHSAVPMSAREQGAMDALSQMMNEARTQRRRSVLRAWRYRAELRELRAAIALHRHETAAGCAVDAALWRMVEPQKLPR